MSKFTPQNTWNSTPKTGTTSNPGPFLAEVMKNDDPQYSGRLLVYIPYFGGDPSLESNWHLVRYMSPYYGIQPLYNRLPSNKGSGNGPIESYGMWMTPPDLGVKVLVTFINGDRSEGVWIGCLPEIGSHAAIPGQDKGDFDVYAPNNYKQASTDVKSLEGARPAHSTAGTFQTQGISGDPVRGPISSSSFRDSPSKVFGFNTPGSHSFVMDDGDESGKSKLIRIRTAAGNQIMMNDDSGLMYLINSQGTGWIEISPTGQIDVYGSKGINLATEGDLNLHANKDVNIHAGNSLKMVAGKGAKLQGTEELQLHGKKLFVEGVDSIEMHSCKEIKITSFKDIHVKAFENYIIHAKCFKFNSGTVKEAEQVPPEKPKDLSGYKTTVARAPSKEPYKEHDSGSGGGSSSGGGRSSSSSSSSSTADSNSSVNMTLAPGVEVASSVTDATTDLVNNEHFNEFMQQLVEGGLTNPNGLAAMAATIQRESGSIPDNIFGTWSNNGTPVGGILAWSNSALESLQASGLFSTVAGQAKFFLQENQVLVSALQTVANVIDAQELMSSVWRYNGFQNSVERTLRDSLTQVYFSLFGSGNGINFNGLISNLMDIPTTSINLASDVLNSLTGTSAPGLNLVTNAIRVDASASSLKNTSTTESTVDVPVTSTGPVISPGTGYDASGSIDTAGDSDAQAAADEYAGGNRSGGEFGGTPITDPAAEAAAATPGVLGQSPTSTIPAKPGGGDTGGFAKGNNCKRPSDGSKNSSGGKGNPAGGKQKGTPGAVSNGSGNGYGDVEKADVEKIIRNEAALRGLDPDTAMAVAQSEGFDTYIGDGGLSGGPFQLYTGGGLGNEFVQQTGINHLTDRSLGSITKQIQFSLDNAATGGWGPWYGAGRIGLSKTAGGAGSGTAIGNWK